MATTVTVGSHDPHGIGHRVNVGKAPTVRQGASFDPIAHQAADASELRCRPLPIFNVTTLHRSVGKAAVRTLGGAYELPELASEEDNAENLEVMLEGLVKASVIEINDLKPRARCGPSRNLCLWRVEALVSTITKGAS